MMISSSNEKQNIKIANYFDDLKILAAFYRKFPCNIIHRKTNCRPDCFSLELILNGKVYLNLDNKKILLQSPCVFWIGSRTQYFQYELIPGVSYDHYWIDFTGARGKRIYDSLSDSFPDSFVPLKSGKNIRNIFEYFTNKFQLARRPASSPEDILKIEQMIYELARENDKIYCNSHDPYGIKKLAEHIHSSPFEKYNLPQLAQQSSLSYVHFRTLFKELTGQSIGQYILEQQMLTAGELLKSRQFRIGELADYCGFIDIASFTRAFKRYYKVSPKQWLSENQGL